MQRIDFDHWPYPRWVAHRGAGRLAPENTLAAFRLGASHGWRMFECDVKLSRDGVPFLLHDDTLERTTNGRGIAGELDWHTLSQLDAGTWHGPGYSGEAPPTFAALTRYLRANDLLLDLEIKPTKGQEAPTGGAVAQACLALWGDAPVPPLITSFQPLALAAAREPLPGWAFGLLLDELWDGWFDVARQLQCAAIVLNHARVDRELVARLHGERLRVGVYTPNSQEDVRRMVDAGVDMICTDSVASVDPRAA